MLGLFRTHIFCPSNPSCCQICIPVSGWKKLFYSPYNYGWDHLWFRCYERCNHPCEQLANVNYCMESFKEYLNYNFDFLNSGNNLFRLWVLDMKIFPRWNFWTVMDKLWNTMESLQQGTLSNLWVRACKLLLLLS